MNETERQRARQAGDDSIHIWCPACESRMTPRRNLMNGHIFWGCSRFPHCKCTKPLDYESVIQFLQHNNPSDQTALDMLKQILPLVQKRAAQAEERLANTPFGYQPVYDINWAVSMSNPKRVGLNYAKSRDYLYAEHARRELADVQARIAELERRMGDAK